jgi:hypothetical protein
MRYLIDTRSKGVQGTFKRFDWDARRWHADGSKFERKMNFQTP